MAIVPLVLASPTGCSRAQATATQTPGNEKFTGPFHSETEYIVSAIASDVAEQINFAATGSTPSTAPWPMLAKTISRTNSDSPVIEIHGFPCTNGKELRTSLTIPGPIWDPAAYIAFAKEIANAADLKPKPKANPRSHFDVLPALLDTTAITIQRQNEELSKALQKDFSNPELHESAALLLGVFCLRDHSGRFFDLRAPLSRMTAHLVFARLLRDQTQGQNGGSLAEAMLFTLTGNQSLALDTLSRINTNDPVIAAFSRALKLRMTGQCRVALAADHRSDLETLECFCALARQVGSSVAWGKFTEDEKSTIGFARAVNQYGASVELGHVQLARAVKLELDEFKTIALWSGRGDVDEPNLVQALNAAPERCFTRLADGSPSVNVVGWGQWANFLQRHLCNALRCDYSFLKTMLAVESDARNFVTACDTQFGGLQMYPLLSQFFATNQVSHDRAIASASKFAFDFPHLVPESCWYQMTVMPAYARYYSSGAGGNFYDWFNCIPLPGTAYDLESSPFATTSSASPEVLWKRAPYNVRLCTALFNHLPLGGRTFDKAVAIYTNVLPLNSEAVNNVASTLASDPQKYEEFMLKAAEVDPTRFYRLATYFLDRGDADKVARYYDKACEADPDAVRVSNTAEWRVRYYYKKGDVKRAREIADEAAAVYSSSGLHAKAWLLEAEGDYDAALEYYRNIEERYGHTPPLLSFCARHQSNPGNGEFARELERRTKLIFPAGQEKVSLHQLTAPPKDGVIINAENALLQSCGMHHGDIIVACYGYRARTMNQYSFLRDTKQVPQLDLIVWQHGAYHELQPSPPNHLFGLDFQDYLPN